MMVAPWGRAATLALSAAGFMATSTLGESPGVEMSWSEMWTWKADTPARVPAGALISAGKSGNVARSLPNRARRRGETVPRQLHAVARVAGEPDDHAVDQVGGFRLGGGVGHLAPLRTALPRSAPDCSTSPPCTGARSEAAPGRRTAPAGARGPTVRHRRGHRRGAGTGTGRTGDRRQATVTSASR